MYDIYNNRNVFSLIYGFPYSKSFKRTANWDKNRLQGYGSKSKPDFRKPWKYNGNI